VNWYRITADFHKLTFAHKCRLNSLSEEWQRELAALWRLEADVNNGAYLQFLENWGRESYADTSQALKKIGAARMAEIVDQCQALVDELVDGERRPGRLKRLLANPVIDLVTGNLIQRRSVLPRKVRERIYELSYEFMDYPDDISALGTKYYSRSLEIA